MTQSEIRAKVAVLRLGRVLRAVRVRARFAQLVRKPLTVESFLRGKGLDGGVLRSVWGTFGKRVKAAYADAHQGRKPETFWQTIVSASGSVREVEVVAYRVSDLPLLQGVWNRFYAV